MTLSSLQKEWVDEPQYHKQINDLFARLVDAEPALKEHRDFVQDNVWGMGERSFWWLWALLLVELPEPPKLIEIGCLKGATLSVWRQLRTDAIVFGVTPLSTAGGVWDDDYMVAIKTIHDKFNAGHMPYLYIGFSEDEKIINQVKNKAPYDLLYVDGSHSYQGVMSDLVHYSPLVKNGGYMVMDDCCNDMEMPFGFFQGIQSVTDATIDYMKGNGDKWEFIFSVVHLRIFRKI